MNIYDGKLSSIIAVIGTISTWLFGVDRFNNFNGCRLFTRYY
ncbi:hypothetical protein [Clostridioides difficile]|nr:hypothetical protein [Clostridioides difficile]AXU73235.1 hypothetical protein CDIF28668_03360 [Clostridioides difficile]